MFFNSGEKTINMRILHLIKNFDFGGAENHVRELANSQEELGHNVFIIAGRGRQEFWVNKGVRFISLPMRDSLIPVLIPVICYLSIKNRVQVIHAHQRLPIFLACIIGKITGVPVVVTVHGRTRYDLRSRISRKYCTKIIFVSRYVLQVSARYEEIKHKSIIIPNWVAISNNQSDKDPHSISYISRIDKNHTTIILLMIQKVLFPLVSKFPDIKINIIGDGVFLPEIREEAKRLNTRVKREACIIYAFAPDVKRIIHGSELILGVGRVALEALACGVPVLSINQKRMGTIISTDNYPFYRDNNFVAVGYPAPDENSLINQIDEFFTDLKYWQKEASLLKGYINEDFNPRKMTDSIELLYDETIKSRKNIMLPVLESGN
ncbi:MAG TPA: glycosyltransferase family 4 protein [Bacteroidales bacterium]